LSRRGYDLALMARGDDIHALAGELGAGAVTGTVTSEPDLWGLVEAALVRHGRLDAVVNTTGHAPWATSST
jgi:NADP-dependent 3-hydroxy acid dehydrogenase YdfG